MKSIHDSRAASDPSLSFAGAETEGGQNTHPGRPWLAVFVLLPLGVLAFVDRMSPSLLIDPIKASLGIDDRGMGLLQGAAFAVPFLLGSLPMGWIVDRCSNRLVIYFGVLFWSAATLFCGFASSFAMLLAGRCLVGLGEAAFQPAAWSMVARVFPPHGRVARAIRPVRAAQKRALEGRPPCRPFPGKGTARGRPFAKVGFLLVTDVTRP